MRILQSKTCATEAAKGVVNKKEGIDAIFSSGAADSCGYSSNSSSSKSGGRCYVGGYITKTGEKVSGYYRDY